MHLSELHTHCYWPSPESIRNPPGSGPALFKRLARLKIEAPLARSLGSDSVSVNVLCGDPASGSSDPPVALVCEFNRALTREQLKKTRSLAWNFCRTPLLFTIEPHLIRAWSCYEQPDAQTGEFPDSPVKSFGDGASIDLTALADTLHWSLLASGRFLEEHRNRFDRSQRADTLLLKNLRYVRDQLTETTELVQGLSLGTAHDLLARVVFLQFLLDRKDSQGHPALNERTLAALHESGVLAQRHESLSSILRHKRDTFELFKWLNARFNGDLFPRSYSAEVRDVKTHHLAVLAEFVSGNLKMDSGQYLLWPHYSFDTIPLEFISSIYEEFVTKSEKGVEGTGEHYTRPFLVDFMLDKVLPWGGSDYDLKILDPCCGSAVFLVKAFQRLIQRWRNANQGKSPGVPLLRSLLENNLFGVDTNENAVRVASFSLYLAMCDEIDPRHYWSRVTFPTLRESRICTADFFAEDIPGIRTEQDSKRYDLIVGNAPWGRGSLTETASDWAHQCDTDRWPTVDKQLGTLFLPKAARLCKADGRICMIQPAGSLLFNIDTTATQFRDELFRRYKVDEIVNLSALRFQKLFPKAVGPACIVTMRSIRPDGEAIAYWSPKNVNNSEDAIRLVIDEQDLNWVWPDEAAKEPVVWPALMFGGRRDLELIRARRNKFPSLKTYIQGKSERGFERRWNVVKGYPDRVGVRVLESHDLWKKLHITASASTFPRNRDPSFYRPKHLELFRLPVAIMKKSWTIQDRRFKVVAVPKNDDEFLLFSQSFFGVHVDNDQRLATFAACANSIYAVYHFFLSSGRLASYRPSLTDRDIREFPIPPKSDLTLRVLKDKSLQEVDDAVLRLYELSESERALVQDFCDITFPDFKSAEAKPGKVSVSQDSRSESILGTYSDYLRRVLQAGFGSGKNVCATVFCHPNSTSFCMVGIHLDWERPEPVRFEDVTDNNLLSVLATRMEVNPYDGHGTQTDSIYYQRVSRIYQHFVVNEGNRKREVPTVFLIKPNQVRYWTRSAALRDADNVVAELMQRGRPDVFNEDAAVG